VTRLQFLHRVLGLLCLAFVTLIVVGNTVLNSAPGGLGYFKRGDVAALLGLGAVLAVVLFWASAGDTDRRRTIGSIASGTMTGLLLGTVSIPVLAVPLSVIGCFRLPESRSARIALLVLVPLGAVVGVALPYLGRSLTAIV
jgi:drug/metabolite transporter (DMT)-like permease